jgi:hypothetical protein
LNAVEIEEAISSLAEQAFDAQEFPFTFLQAFGNKETTIRRLRAGASNKSDLGGVLQTNNIHIAVCPPGEVTKILGALKVSPATARAKARFILATDGADFEAEDLETGETVACAYQDFPDHFGFFLPLAGITTVKQVRESSFDIRATSRLNRLYVELLKNNADRRVVVAADIKWLNRPQHFRIEIIRQLVGLQMRLKVFMVLNLRTPSCDEPPRVGYIAGLWCDEPLSFQAHPSFHESLTDISLNLTRQIVVVQFASAGTLLLQKVQKQRRQLFWLQIQQIFFGREVPLELIQVHLPQSSSASRIIAGASRFLNFSQSGAGSIDSATRGALKRCLCWARSWA